MKIIQTFYIPKNQREKPLFRSYGWFSAEYHWLCWVLSFLKIKEQFSYVELVTDAEGEKILVELLNLNYDSVKTDFENSDWLNQYPSELWALAKLHTYQQQNEPFLHIDGDIFWGNQFENHLQEAPLIAQNIEKNIYYKVIEGINTHFEFIPEFLKEEHYAEDKEFYSINAGFIGGNDTNFFKNYAIEAKGFVDKNLNSLSQLNGNLGYLNVIFEQFYFHHLAQSQNKFIKTIIPKPVEDAFYAEVIDIFNYPNINIFHPVGSHKKNYKFCRKIAQILRSEYPEYYYRVIRLLSDNDLEFHLAFYRLIEFDSSEKIVFRADWIEKLKEFEPKPKFSPELKKIQTNGSILSDAEAFENEVISFFKTSTADQTTLLNHYENQKNDFLFDDVIQDNLIENQSFSINDEAVIIENQYDWAEIDAFGVEQYFQSIPEPDTLYTALVFDAMMLSVNYYSLSNVACVIYQVLESEKGFNEVLQEVEGYFDSESIKNDYENYRNLIKNTLIYLIKANIILPKKWKK